MLDALVRCSTVAFDKTGTLTTGALSCTSMLPLHQSHSNGAGLINKPGQALLQALCAATPLLTGSPGSTLVQHALGYFHEAVCRQAFEMCLRT